MTAKKILEMIPSLQSAGLIGENVKFVKKKKKKAEDFMEEGVKNIMGVTLISSTADLIDSV